MNTKVINSVFLGICFTIIILYSLVPIVGRAISIYVSTYAYMLVLLLTAILTVFGNRIKSLNRYINLLFPFILMRLIPLIFDKNSLVEWGYSSLLELIPIVIGYFVITRFNGEKYLTAVISISILITCVTTIIGLRQYPDASRWIATVTDSQNPMLIKYDLLNIGGYGFVYTAILLYPIAIYAYKLKKLHLVPTLLIAALVGYMAFTSGYTIAFLLFCATTCLIFFRRNLRFWDIVVISILAIAVYFLFTAVFANLFAHLATLTGNENMSERFTALAGGLSGVEGSESERIKLYKLSIDIFKNHPLLGNMIKKHGTPGGHSYILDTLANYGLVGALLMIAMYRKIYTVFISDYRESTGYGYILWTFIQAIVLSLLNTGMWLYVLCLFVPVILNALSDGDDEENDDEEEGEESEDDESIMDS